MASTDGPPTFASTGGPGAGGPTAPGGRAPLDTGRVARIGYGAMQLAERVDRGPLPPDQAVAVLRRARELGVDHIDTAEFYGEGVANRLIRSALAPYPDDLVLVSKVGAQRSGATLVAAQRPEQLRAQVDANLRSLGCDRLAVVNLRRADGPVGIVAEGEQVVDLDDQLATMSALRDEGKIGGFGLSSVTAEQIAASLPAGPVCVQNSYNLLDREAETELELCAAHGLAWVPFFPLGSGFPGQRTVPADPVVRDIAAGLGASPAQVGLAWLLTHDPGTLLIPGTANVEHLEQNVAAGALHLDATAMAALDARSDAPVGSTDETSAT